MKSILKNYTSYNLWANKRILDSLTSIDPSLLDKELKSSFPTLTKTICHIWGAEDIWHQRLNRIENPSVIGFHYSGPTDEAFEAFIKMSATFNDFVSGKNDAFFQDISSYKDLRGNPHTNTHWQMIMHCMNHSTYHRGQIITMLREVGATDIPNTDLMGYIREGKK